MIARCGTGNIGLSIVGKTQCGMGVSLHKKVRREVIEANALRLRVNPRSFTEARSRYTSASKTYGQLGVAFKRA